MSFGDGEFEKIQDLARNAIGGPQERAQAELAMQPPIGAASEFYWKAYEKLNSDRPLGMSGAGLIPLHCIRDFGKFIGLTRAEYEVFESVIRKIDGHHTLLKAKRAAKKAKAKSS